MKEEIKKNMEIRQKDNSIKIAIIVIVLGALIGLGLTHSFYGALKGVLGGFLVVMIGGFYQLFKENF